MVKKVWKDAVPTMIAMLFAGLYGVIDGIFIGNATGDVGLAAINIAWPIPALITAIGTGIGVGGSIWISYYRGKKAKEKESCIWGCICTMILLSGLIITSVLWNHKGILQFLGATGEVYIEASSYVRIIVAGAIFQIAGAALIPVLRNQQMAIEAMSGMIAGMILNIGINYYLIFGKDLGIKGAAYGTVIAQGMVMLFSIGCMVGKRKEKLRLGWNLNEMKKIASSMLTPFGVSFAPTIALIFTNWKCLTYGGDTAVASYAVIAYISFPVQSLLAGIGDGTQPLISFYCGAGKEREVKEIRKIAQQLILITGGMTMFCSILLTEQIGTLFGISTEGFHYFDTGLKITALSFVLVGWTKFHMAYLNATMRTRESVCYLYFESLFVTPLLLQILPVFFKVYGIWMTPFVTAVCMLMLFFRKNKKVFVEGEKNDGK